MKFRLHSLVLFLALTASICAFAQEQLQNCAEVFAEFMAARQDKSALAERDAYIFTSQSTVHFAGEFPGEHGGKRLKIYIKKGSFWGSQYAEMGYDVQGDPRWFLETVGPKAAEFFGFKMIDDLTMMVPDPKEFIGALKKVDAELAREGKPPLGVTFYEAGDNENTAPLAYVRKFRTRHEIPLAEDGNHLVHDLSAHTGAIFMPKDLIEYHSELLDFRDGFFRYIRGKYNVQTGKEAISDARQQMIKDLDGLVKFHETVEIDNATGFVNVALLDQATTVSPDKAKSMNRAARFFVEGKDKESGSHADQYREWFRTRLYNPSLTRHGTFPFGFKEERKLRIARGLKDTYSYEQILKDFDEYMAAYQPKDPARFDARKSYLENRNFKTVEDVYDDICVKITKLRMDVIHAVDRLQAPTP